MDGQAAPIENRISATFIPVRDIKMARDWYCKILGLSTADCTIMNGHLCPLPMEGAGIILDQMPMWGGKEAGGPPTYQTPAFMFATQDVQKAYEFMTEQGVDLVTEVQYNKWFVFRDPDGNKLMVCQ